MPDKLTPISQTEDKQAPQKPLENAQKEQEKAEEMVLAQSEREVKAVKNEVKVNIDAGIAVSSKEGQQNPYSALRLTAQGKVFKETAGETDVYSLFYLDGNPLTSTPYGKVTFSKKVFDLGKTGKFNMEAEYVFWGKNGNVMKYGVSYAGKLKNGWYKIKIVPLTTDGNPVGTSFDVGLSGNVQVGKNGNFSAIMNMTGLQKADPNFYSELTYNHKIAEGLSLFWELRTTGTFTNPSLAPMAGVRMKIK